MDQAKIEQFNHWWTQKQVDPDLALPFKRENYNEILEHTNKKFITAITGLRRTGKTTTMYQIINHLLKQKTKPENILFFSFDETTMTINEAIQAYIELQKKDLRKEKIYVFLDEIQKCKNWENEIKKHYDLYPKIKFVITGSESLFIRKKTKETLAGRIFEFEMAPFTFTEYLKYQGVPEKDFKYETTIKPYFREYIEKGGFPETFTLKKDKYYKEYITSLVVDKIIYKDIPTLYKIEDPRFLRILLETISTNPGMYIDYQSLSKKLGKDRRVIKNYVTYLQDSYLIRLLGNYRKGSITTLRKMKRAYPTDNSFTKIFVPTINETTLGKMVETTIVNKLKATAFWKNTKEIDIIHNNEPIEIKYQETITNQDLKPLKEFIKKHNAKKGILITKHHEKKGTIKQIPAWKYHLTKT